MVTRFFHYDYTEQLSKVFNKVKKGEPLKVGFLGGSITQGCHASKIDNTYVMQVMRWLKEQFVHSNISSINAGIGATGSFIAAHRVVDDLLNQKPDIIFIEFAANDVPPNCETRQSYESLIKRIIMDLPGVAVVLVFMTLQDGVSAEGQQTQIGHHYKVPMVSVRQEIFNRIKAGEYTWWDIEADEVHPNDRGHKIIADLITQLLDYAASQVIEKEYRYEMPEDVLFSDKYRDGVILNNSNLKPSFLNCFELCDEGFKTLKDGWIGKGKEAVFKCEITAREIFLLYTKGVDANRAKVTITIDESKEIELDSYFKGGWGNYAETRVLISEETPISHTIEIKLNEESLESIFTLLGFLAAGRQ